MLLAVLLASVMTEAFPAHFGAQNPLMGMDGLDYVVSASKSAGSEDGRFHIVVLAPLSAAPSSEEVIAGTGSASSTALWSGDAGLTSAVTSVTYPFSGVTAFDVWVTAADAQGISTTVPGRFVVPDVAAPVIGVPVTAAFSSASMVDITLTVDQVATVHCVVQSGDTPPTADDIRAGTAGIVAFETTWLSSFAPHKHSQTFGDGVLDFSLHYNVACTTTGHGINALASALVSMFPLSAGNEQPPGFSLSTPQVQLLTASSVEISVALDEPGAFFCLVRSPTEPVPTVEEVRGGHGPVAVSAEDSIVSMAVDSLKQDTQYIAYIVAEDLEVSMVLQSDVTAVAFDTQLPPAFAAGSPSIGASGAQVSVEVQLDEPGWCWALALEDGAVAPLVAAIVGDAGEEGLRGDVEVVSTTSPVDIVVAGVSEATSYDVYVVCRDAVSNWQLEPVMLSVDTPDVSPPEFHDGYPTASVQSDSATVEVRLTEAGWCAIVALPDGATAPSVDFVSGSDGEDSGDALQRVTASLADPSAVYSLQLSSLSPETTYHVYVACRDASLTSNWQLIATLIEVTTPDVSPPAFTNATPTVGSTNNGTALSVAVSLDESGYCGAIAVAEGGTTLQPTDILWEGLSELQTVVAVTGSDVPVEIHISGVAEATTYTVFVACKDAAVPPNVQSSALAVAVFTPDITAPEFSAGFPRAGSINDGNSFSVAVELLEAGRCFSLALPVASPSPTIPQVTGIEGEEGDAVVGLRTSVSISAAGVVHALVFHEAEANTDYRVYVACQDAAPITNLQSSLSSIEIKTADVSAPVFSAGYPAVGATNDGHALDIVVQLDRSAVCFAAATVLGGESLTTLQLAQTATFKDGTVSVNVSVPLADVVYSMTLRGVASDTSYEVAVACRDAGSNGLWQTVPSFVWATTPDITPPTFAVGFPAELPTADRSALGLVVKLDEPGHCFVVAQPCCRAIPSVLEVVGGHVDGEATLLSASVDVQSASVAYTMIVSNVQSLVLYDVFVACRDSAAAPNWQVTPARIEVLSPDTEPPQFVGQHPAVGAINNGSAFSITIQLSEPGWCVASALEDAATPSSLAAVLELLDASTERTADTVVSDGIEAVELVIDGVLPQSDFGVTLFCRDDATVWNWAPEPAFVLVATPDIGAPRFTDGFPRLGSETNSTAVGVDVSISEAGQCYVVVAAAGAAAPEPAQLANVANSEIADPAAELDITAPSASVSVIITGLLPAVDYTMFVACHDRATPPNWQRSVVELPFATPAATAPIFASGFPKLGIQNDGMVLDVELVLDRPGECVVAAIGCGSSDLDVAALAILRDDGEGALLTEVVAAEADVVAVVELAGVSSESSYDVYVACRDMSVVPTWQTVAAVLQVDTPDITAPEFAAGFPASGSANDGVSFDVVVSLSEPAMCFAVALDDVTAIPSVADIVASNDEGESAIVPASAAVVPVANVSVPMTITGVELATSYSVHVACQDLAQPPNWQPAAAVLSVATPAAAAPTFVAGFPALATASLQTSVGIALMLNEDSVCYASAVPRGADEPAAADVLLGIASGDVLASSIGIGAAAGVESIIEFPDLPSDTEIDVWIACRGTGTTPVNQGRAHRVQVDTPDVLPPQFTSLPRISSVLQSSARLSMLIDESGRIWWCVIGTGGFPLLTKSAVQMCAGGVVGSGSVGVAVPASPVTIDVDITGLSQESHYTAVVVAEDGSGNAQQTPSAVVFTTVDMTPPSFSTWPTVVAASESSFVVSFQLDEAGIVFAAAQIAGEPSLLPAQVRRGQNTAAWGNVTTVGHAPAAIQLGNLIEGTSYDVYIFAEDDSGVPMSSAVSLAVVETPDFTPPTLTVADVVVTQAAQVQIRLALDEVGTCKLLVTVSGMVIPLAEALFTGDSNATELSLHSALETYSIALSDLEQGIDYVAYISCADDAEIPNIVDTVSLLYFTLPDTTAPDFVVGSPTITSLVRDSFVVEAVLSEVGTVAVCVYEQTPEIWLEDSGEVALDVLPTAVDIMQGYCGASVAFGHSKTSVAAVAQVLIDELMLSTGENLLALVAVSDNEDIPNVNENVSLLRGITLPQLCEPILHGVTIFPQTHEVMHLDDLELRAGIPRTSCLGELDLVWSLVEIETADFVDAEFTPPLSEAANVLDRSATNTPTLMIPRGQLVVGCIYRFRLDVTSLLDPTVSAFSDSVVSVLPSHAIDAVILSGSRRSVRQGEPLILDGSSSVDRDGVHQDPFMYDWECLEYRSDETSSPSACEVTQIPSEAVVDVAGGADLPVGLYSFQLNLSKGESGRPPPFHFRAGLTGVVVAVVADDEAAVEIIGPSERIAHESNVEFDVLEGAVQATTPADGVGLQWQVLNAVRLDKNGSVAPSELQPDTHTLYPFASSTLVRSVAVQFAASDEGIIYTFRLTESQGGSSGVGAYAEVTVKVPFSPSGGHVAVVPDTGEAAVTQFTLTAPGWQGAPGWDDLPLRYRFSVRPVTVGDADTLVCAQDLDSTTLRATTYVSAYSTGATLSGVYLPAGDKQLVVAEVITGLGASVCWSCGANPKQPSIASVRSPSLSAAEQVALSDRFSERVLGPALAVGDVEAYLRGIGVIFSVLNAPPLDETLQGSEGSDTGLPASTALQAARFSALESFTDAGHNVLIRAAQTHDAVELFCSAIASVAAAPSPLVDGADLLAVSVADSIVTAAVEGGQFGSAAALSLLDSVGSVMYGTLENYVAANRSHAVRVRDQSKLVFDHLLSGLSESRLPGAETLVLQSDFVAVAAATGTVGSLKSLVAHVQDGYAAVEVHVPEEGWNALLDTHLDDSTTVEIEVVWYAFDAHREAVAAPAARPVSGSVDVALYARQGESREMLRVSKSRHPIAIVVPMTPAAVWAAGPASPSSPTACAYWEEITASWSTRGVSATKIAGQNSNNSGTVTCHSVHLTEFRVQEGGLDLSVKINDFHPIEDAGLVLQRYSQDGRELVITTLSLALGSFIVGYCVSHYVDRRERKQVLQESEDLFRREGTMARPARLDHRSIRLAFEKQQGPVKERPKSPPQHDASPTNSDVRNSLTGRFKNLSVKVWSPARQLVVPIGQPNVVQLFADQLFTMFYTLMKRNHIWLGIFAAPVDARMCVSRPQRVVVLAATFASGMAAAALFLPQRDTNFTREGVAWQNQVVVGLMAAICVVPARTILPLLFKRANTLKVARRYRRQRSNLHFRGEPLSPTTRQAHDDDLRVPGTVDSPHLLTPLSQASSQQRSRPRSTRQGRTLRSLGGVCWTSLVDVLLWLSCGACCCERWVLRRLSASSMSDPGDLAEETTETHRFTSAQRATLAARLRRIERKSVILPGDATASDFKPKSSPIEAPEHAASTVSSRLVSASNLHRAVSADFGYEGRATAESLPSTDAEKSQELVEAGRSQRPGVAVLIGSTPSHLLRAASMAAATSVEVSLPMGDSAADAAATVVAVAPEDHTKPISPLSVLRSATPRSLQGRLPPLNESRRASLNSSSGEPHTRAMLQSWFLEYFRASQEQVAFGSVGDREHHDGSARDLELSRTAPVTVAVTPAEALVLSAGAVLHQVAWDEPDDHDDAAGAQEDMETGTAVASPVSKQSATESPARSNATFSPPHLSSAMATPQSQVEASSRRTRASSRRTAARRVQLSVLLALALLPILWCSATAFAAAVLYVAADQTADLDLAIGLAGGGFLIGTVSLIGFQLAKTRHTVLPAVCLAIAIVLQVYGAGALLEWPTRTASGIFVFLVIQQSVCAVLLWVFSASLAAMVLRTEAYLQDTHNTVTTLFKVMPSLANEFVAAVRAIQGRYRLRRASAQAERGKAMGTWLRLSAERLLILGLLYLVILVFLIYAGWTCIIAGAKFDAVQSRAWVVASLAAFFVDTLLLQPLQLGVRAVLTFIFLMRDGTDRPMLSRVIGKCTLLLNRAFCAVLVFFE